MSRDQPPPIERPVGEPVVGWRGCPLPRAEPMEGRWCRLEPTEAGRHARQQFEANALDVEGAMWTYLPYGPFAEFADYRGWLEALCGRDDALFFSFVDRASGQALGMASFMRMDPENGVIEVGGVQFSPRLQRTPVSTEGQYLMMRHVFDDLGYRRYEWKCDALNAASRAAAERLGFVYEGTFRQAKVIKGRNRDTAWFSILDSEWPARREAFEKWLAPSNFDVEGRQLRSLADIRSG